MKCTKKQIVNQWVEKMLREQKKFFNNLKTEQDQKYLIYNEFRTISDEKHGIKIQKMPGSNQVIASVKGKQVYFSDDGKLSMTDYKKVLAKLLSPLPLKPVKRCK